MKHTKVNRIRITTTKNFHSCFLNFISSRLLLRRRIWWEEMFSSFLSFPNVLFNGSINQTSHRHNESGICEDIINIYMLCAIFNDTWSGKCFFTDCDASTDLFLRRVRKLPSFADWGENICCHEPDWGCIDICRKLFGKVFKVGIYLHDIVLIDLDVMNRKIMHCIALEIFFVIEQIVTLPSADCFTQFNFTKKKGKCFHPRTRWSLCKFSMLRTNEIWFF